MKEIKLTPEMAIEFKRLTNAIGILQQYPNVRLVELEMQSLAKGIALANGAKGDEYQYKPREEVLVVKSAQDNQKRAEHEVINRTRRRNAGK